MGMPWSTKNWMRGAITSVGVSPNCSHLARIASVMSSLVAMARHRGCQRQHWLLALTEFFFPSSLREIQIQTNLFFDTLPRPSNPPPSDNKVLHLGALQHGPRLGSGDGVRSVHVRALPFSPDEMLSHTLITHRNVMQISTGRLPKGSTLLACFIVPCLRAKKSPLMNP